MITIPTRFDLLRSALCLAITVAVSLATTHAGAQNAAADVLFDEGLRLIKEGKDTEAAEKLKQSNELDPAPGTALALAEVYVRLGKTASAWAAYRTAAALAAGRGQTDRQAFAEQQVKLLEPKLSRVTIHVPDESRIGGLSVTHDGKGVPSALWGKPIPLDPGSTTFRAEAPGREPWSLELKIPAESASRTILIPVLPLIAATAEPAAPPPPAVTPKPALSPPAPPPPPLLPADSQPTSPVTYLAYTGLGIGGAALVAGVALYVVGQSRIDDANCPDSVCVRGAGDPDLFDEGRTFETAGGALAIGGGLVAASSVAVLLFSALSSNEDPSVSFGVAPAPGGGTAVFRASF